MADVRALAEREWERVIAPGLEKIDLARGDQIRWFTRVTPPIPSGKSFAYYAYARGTSFQSLKDGEYVGPVWGKIIDGKLTVLTSKIEKQGIQGVRPLTAAEIKIREIDPLAALRAKRSADVKAYYCLQKALGNIPKEVVGENKSFFDGLGCT